MNNYGLSLFKITDLISKVPPGAFSINKRRQKKKRTGMQRYKRDNGPIVVP